MVSVLRPHQRLQRPQEVSELPAEITCHSQRPLLSHPAQVASGEGQLQGTAACQAPSLLCGPTQAAPCAPATLPIRWKPTRSQQARPTPAAGSRRRPLGLEAQGPAVPSAALLPSVSPAGREVRTEKETGSGRALCSRALAPGDLGLLSTESAQGCCWFPGSPEDQTTGRAPPSHLPGLPAYKILGYYYYRVGERPPPPQGSSLSVATPLIFPEGGQTPSSWKLVTAKGQRPCSPAWKSSDSLQPCFPMSHL